MNGSDALEAEQREERIRDAAHDLLEALHEIRAICLEDNATFRKRMGTRVGNALVVAETAIAKAEGRA